MKVSTIVMSRVLTGKYVLRDMKVNEGLAQYFVRKFEDHAAEVARLNEQLQALAAENMSLKHAMSVTLEHVSVLDTGQAGVAAMIINDALHNSETPATDAAIREIGAKAVEVFADDWQGVSSYSAISEMARDYANKLRAGEVQS